MEGLYRLVELLQQQWQVLRQVFGIFIVAVLMVGAAIYLVLDWHYAGTDLAQKATISCLKLRLHSVRRLRSCCLLLSSRLRR